MANELMVQARLSQEYYVRAVVAGREFDLLVDTGFTHPGCLIGVMLDSVNYVAIRGQLRSLVDVDIRPFNADVLYHESGVGTVSLVGLDGSDVETRIVNAGENILGICYFHHLTEFSVFWDLAGRLMIISKTGASDGT